MHIIRQVGTRSFIPALLLFILFIVINSIITPDFLGYNSLETLVATYAPVVLMAIGETIVLIGGGIDISLGSIVSLVNVLLVALYANHWPFSVAIICAVLAGTCVGVLNGLVIARFNVTPLLATFATSSMALGLALWILPTPGGTVPAEFATWYGDSYGFIPVPFLFIVGGYVFWLIWALTPWGELLYAAGKNEWRAFASGAPVRGVKFFSYVSAALLTSIGAVALTANIVSGDPNIGTSDTLNAIAAAVIGGVSLMGGVGEAAGPIFGALFLGLIVTTVLGAQVPAFYQDLISGSIILASIVLTTLVKRRSTRLAVRRAAQ